MTDTDVREFWYAFRLAGDPDPDTVEDLDEQSFRFWDEIGAPIDLFEYDSFQIIDSQTIHFSAVISKFAYFAYFGDTLASKRNFPFKCFHTETELPEKLFVDSLTEPCYVYG